jgi:hypothetical protein
MSSNLNTFKLGERIVPLDGERNPNAYTPADSLTMPESPITVKPLPVPNRIQRNGLAESESSE